MRIDMPSSRLSFAREVIGDEPDRVSQESSVDVDGRGLLHARERVLKFENRGQDVRRYGTQTGLCHDQDETVRPDVRAVRVVVPSNEAVTPQLIDGFPDLFLPAVVVGRIGQRRVPALLLERVGRAGPRKHRRHLPGMRSGRSEQGHRSETTAVAETCGSMGTPSWRLACHVAAIGLSGSANSSGSAFGNRFAVSRPAT